MGRSKGEKAILREEKRKLREHKKQIAEANKMLIPVSEKTNKSLGLMSFDPQGTFRLNCNRWVKMYEVIDCVTKDGNLFAKTLEEIKGRIRLTYTYKEGKEKIYVTLIGEGEIYEDVRKDIVMDQEALSKIFTLKPLTVDETMKVVMGEGCKPFSYASMVRSKRDWSEECLPTIREEASCFKANDMYGECLFFKQYPSILSINQFQSLRDIGSIFSIATDLKTVEDKSSFDRALEQRYNRRISKDVDDTYINMSMSIMFSCDSDDARAIVEKTLVSMFSSEGFALAPCIGLQASAAVSVMTLGMTDYTVMRNVKLSEVGKIIEFVGGCYGSN